MFYIKISAKNVAVFYRKSCSSLLWPSIISFFSDTQKDFFAQRLFCSRKNCWIKIKLLSAVFCPNRNWHWIFLVFGSYRKEQKINLNIQVVSFPLPGLREFVKKFCLLNFLKISATWNEFSSHLIFCKNVILSLRKCRMQSLHQYSRRRSFPIIHFSSKLKKIH